LVALSPGIWFAGCGSSVSDAGRQAPDGGNSSGDSGAAHADSGSGSTGADSGLGMTQTCIPLSCDQSCGAVPNGCGGTMLCGACPTGEDCNSAGQCVGADAGADAGSIGAGDAGEPADGCAPACSSGDVCLSTQVQGGCVSCNHLPPSYSCATLPAACVGLPSVSCTCAKSLCPAAYTCLNASVTSVTCVEEVP
jgi:hypothetical protein